MNTIDTMVEVKEKITLPNIVKPKMLSGSRLLHPILAGASIERWWGGLSGPRAGVCKANSCVIVSRAWENVPLAGRWRDLTPEPLVKKTCVLPDSIVMLMSTSTLLNLMLTFFLSFFGRFFSFSLSPPLLPPFFLVTCLWENLLRSYSVKLINQAFAADYNREPPISWKPTKSLLFGFWWSLFCQTCSTDRDTPLTEIIL